MKSEKEYCPKCGGNVSPKPRPFAYSPSIYDGLYSGKTIINYYDQYNNDTINISKCPYCKHTWDDADKKKESSGEKYVKTNK